MIKGLSNREIAEQLVVTVSTVKATQSHLYRKLRVKNRVQAIARGRELDLLFGNTKASQDKTESNLVVSLPEPANPYKGLKAFESADSQDFFGREDLFWVVDYRVSLDGLATLAHRVIVAGSILQTKLLAPSVSPMSMSLWAFFVSHIN